MGFMKDHYAHDDAYMDIVMDIDERGTEVQGRNKMVKKVHGRMARYNLSEDRGAFPLLLSKKVLSNSVFKELFWMNRGDTNINTLGCKIWDKWADENGELGPVYGKQLRNQVFFKLAATQEQFDTYKKAGYVDFGVAELTEDQMIEEFGKATFSSLRTNGLVVGHPVEDENGNHWLEFPVSLMRLKVDQLKRAEHLLNQVNETGVCDRRIIISLWNNADLDMQALPPCHTLYHFLPMPMSEKDRYEWFCNDVVTENMRDDKLVQNILDAGENPYIEFRGRAEAEINSATFAPDLDCPSDSQELTISQALDQLNVPKFRLDLALYQRSNDFPAGVPFNVASYALQLMLFCKSTNMAVGEFIHFHGDCHIYEDQFDAIHTHLEQYKTLKSSLDPESDMHLRHYPTLLIKERKPIEEYTFEDIEVQRYEPMDFIYVPVTE